MTIEEMYHYDTVYTFYREHDKIPPMSHIVKYHHKYHLQVIEQLCGMYLEGKRWKQRR